MMKKDKWCVMKDKFQSVCLSSEDIEFFLTGNVGEPPLPSSKLCGMMMSTKENNFDIPALITHSLFSARNELLQCIRDTNNTQFKSLNETLIPLYRGITALAKKMDIEPESTKENSIDRFLTQAFANARDLHAEYFTAEDDIPDPLKELKKLIRDDSAELRP